MKQTADIHELEIMSSRVGGFGGSDASLVMTAAAVLRSGGRLGTTIRKRLRVLTGIDGPENFGGNEATAAGRAFEDKVAATLPQEWRREYVIRGRQYRNYRVFAHADFYNEGQKAVKECKWTGVHTPAGLADRYCWQLQWYYMLGADSVSLVYRTANETGVMDIPRNNASVQALEEALALIDEALTRGMNLNLEEISEDELAPATLKMIKDLVALTAEKSELENSINELREKLRAVMAEKGHVRYFGQFGSINRTDGCVRKTFDTKRFADSYPDLYASFLRETTAKGGITISTKRGGRDA